MLIIINWMIKVIREITQFRICVLKGKLNMNIARKSNTCFILSSLLAFFYSISQLIICYNIGCQLIICSANITWLAIFTCSFEKNHRFSQNYDSAFFIEYFTKTLQMHCVCGHFTGLLEKTESLTTLFLINAKFQS